MRLTLFVFVFVLSKVCMASEIDIARGGGSNIPKAAIEVRATHISIDITADASEEKGLLNEWEALRRFRLLVESQAKLKGHIRVDRVASTYLGRESKKSFGSYGASSNYRLLLSTPLRADESFISAASRLSGFINEIQPGEVVEFRVGSYSLAVENKSNYRGKLLSNISEEIESAKKILGDGYKARVYDFTDKIIVEQVGEETVSLYFNYSIEFSQ